MNRREVLSATGAVSLAALAGCASQTSSTSEDSTMQNESEFPSWEEFLNETTGAQAAVAYATYLQAREMYRFNQMFAEKMRVEHRYEGAYESSK